MVSGAAKADAVAGALRRRGVADTAAILTAEAGITVFRVAFERWVTDAPAQDFCAIIRASLDELKAVTAGRRKAMISCFQ